MLRTIVLSTAAIVTLLASPGAFALNYDAQIREDQKRACEADVMKFCKDEMPSEEKITVCMKAHKPQLSSGCLEMFKKAGQ